MTVTLFYLHDPMCSWCWGFRPTWDEIQATLAVDFPNIKVSYVAGGLAADSTKPMPEAMRQAIEGFWKKITAQLGTTFNHDFWVNNTPRRSTYHACRAVLAAKRQQREQPMIDAIQRGYYLRAMNPSDESILIQLAGETLDSHRVSEFCDDLRSPAVEQELQQNIAKSRQFQTLGLANGFPSLVLQVNAESYAITTEYKNANAVIAQIASHVM